MLEAPILAAPQTKGHVSVARLARHWYVACRSKELGTRPLARTLLGVLMALFAPTAVTPPRCSTAARTATSRCRWGRW